MAVGPTSLTNSKPFYNALFATNAGLNPVFAFSLTNAAGSLTVGGDKTGQDVSSINKLTVIGDVRKSSSNSSLIHAKSYKFTDSLDSWSGFSKSSR